MADGEASHNRASTSLEGAMNVTGDTPIISRVAGVDFITVPLAHYRHMAASSGMAEGVSSDQARVLHGPRRVRLSRLHKDAEVFAFIVQRLGTADLTDIREAVRARFGAERTPSKSSLSRFSVRRREEALAVARHV